MHCIWLWLWSHSLIVLSNGWVIHAFWVFVLAFLIFFSHSILYGFYWSTFYLQCNFFNVLMYEFVQVLIAFFKLLFKLFYAFKCVLFEVPTSFYYFELSASLLSYSLSQSLFSNSFVGSQLLEIGSNFDNFQRLGEYYRLYIIFRITFSWYSVLKQKLFLFLKFFGIKNCCLY